MEYMDKLVAVCESADNITLANVYTEAAIDIKQIGNKISNGIKKLIETVKAFTEKARIALESAKVNAALKMASAKAAVSIKWTYDDKGAAKIIYTLLKEETKIVKEIRKIHDKCMTHKIDIKTADAMLAKKLNEYDNWLFKLNDIIASFDNDENESSVALSNSYTISASLKKVSILSDKAIIQSYNYVEGEMERLRKEAEAIEEAAKFQNKAKAAAKKAGSAVVAGASKAVKKSGEVISTVGASFKSKVAALLARVHRTTTTNISKKTKLKQAVSSFLSKIKSALSRKDKAENNKKKKGKYVKEDTDLMEALDLDPDFLGDPTAGDVDPGEDYEDCGSGECAEDGDEASNDEEVNESVDDILSMFEDRGNFNESVEEETPNKSLDDMINELYSESAEEYNTDGDFYFEGSDQLEKTFDLDHEIDSLFD